MATWRTVVRTSYLPSGGPGYSTFHWRDPGLNPQADVEEAAEALRQAYLLLAPSLPSSTSFFCDGRFVEVDGDRLLQAPTWTFTGTSATGNLEPLPPANQICVTWRTDSNSRSGRGRTFLGGWTEDNSVSGLVGATARGRVVSMANSIVAYNGGADNGAFVVYSATQGIARDITGASVGNQWAILRSRRD